MRATTLPCAVLALLALTACLKPNPTDLNTTGLTDSERTDDSTGDDSSGPDDSSDPDDSGPAVEDCTDGRDNDGDGDKDCADDDCADLAVCQEDCGDGDDNDQDGARDCEDADCTGDDACAPTLDAVSPDWGWTIRATEVTLTGAGFDYATSGLPTVRFGGVEATEVTVLDDSTLTATAPLGSAGESVDVEVITANGSATLEGGFTYQVPYVYAFDGKAGLPGLVYRIDVDKVEAEVILDLSFGVTGAAFSPDGDLVVVSSTLSGNLADAELYRVDVDASTSTFVGVLEQSDGTLHTSVADITFVEGRLLGFSQLDDQIIEIDPSTAQVTPVGEIGINGAGGGFACDSQTGTLLLSTDSAQDSLYKVNPSTGALTKSVKLTGLDSENLNAMTFHDGQLLAVSSGYWTGGATLVSIDLSTGTVTTLLELNNSVDALASPLP